MWERDYFPIFFFFGKQPIENKPYFYKSFPLTKDSFPLTNYFLCYQILDNMKTIFIESFPAKQTECKLRNKSTSVKFQWCCKQRMSSHTNIFISWFANLSSAIYKWQTGFLGLIWFLVAETLAMTMFLLK